MNDTIYIVFFAGLLLLIILGLILLYAYSYPLSRLGRWYRKRILGKSPDNTKKERARELYYRRLYEEVTKFNIESENLDYESLQYLADSHGKIGNKKEALDLYKQAELRAKLEEEGFDLHAILKDKAVTLYNIGAYEDTIDTLREYPNEFLNEEIVQSDFSIVAMMGYSFFALKQYDAAIETFRRGDIKKFSKEVIYGLAKSYEKRGGEKSVEHALRYYERILTVDKKFKDVKERIYRLKNPLQAPPNIQEEE